MKATKWVLMPVVALAAVFTAVVVALQEPIPVAGTAATGNSRVYNGAYADVIASVHEQLDVYRASLVAPSISVAVGVRGELVWADARGYADIDRQALATPDTLYAIGSVAKPVTAVLTAELWERGLLGLDSDVRRYVPSFPAKAYPVTLRQLLSHQAGIRHYGFAWQPPVFSESSLNREFATIGEALSLFADDKLRFEPDTDFNYSTFGYTLIAAAIENVTGLPYLDALRTHVLEPLGMQHTSIDHVRHMPGERSTDYVGTFSKKAVIRAPATNSSYKWAGGGLVSTPSDLVRLGNAMLRASLLEQDTLEVMLTSGTLPSGEKNPQHYGLGWRIGGLVVTDNVAGEEEIIPLIHHGGTRAGSAAILMIVPDHGIVVAMTSNSIGRGGSGPLTGVAAKVARAFIGMP